jgi:effector-binding domain-containing protein
MRSRIETARPGLTARAGAAKAARLAARLTAATIMAVALAATPLAAQTPPAAPGATSPAPTTTPAAPGSAPTAPAVRPSADAPSGSPAQTPAAAPAAAPSPAPNSAPAPAAAPAASPTKPAPAEPPLPVEKPAPATPTPPAPPAPAPAPQSSQPAPADAETSLVTLPARPAAVLRVASAWPDGYPNILSAFARLAKALETEGLKPAGKPLAVLVETRDDGFTFEAMAPIAAAPAGKTELTPDIKFGETPSGRAYKFQHRSAYDDLDTTYEAITAFLDDKGLEAKDQIIEEYLTTPREADDTGLQVDIYVMLKK